MREQGSQTSSQTTVTPRPVGPWAGRGLSVLQIVDPWGEGGRPQVGRGVPVRGWMNRGAGRRERKGPDHGELARGFCFLTVSV